ncbi:ScpA family protein [uncultured Megasphaera sp.]|uniref:segregation and condensation protein A n=1 Tax=uncultured Megasphaera sp. TaxID=165188 RepID=UPI00259940D4|nr:segregation/condensation protein A [uncultured Megasphaera sp.]
MEYQYKVSDFEGPLDLLLYLIEKNKVDIYNIPIVEITDQFQAYIKQLHGFDVNYASKFFLMAATLLKIKSYSLLPKTAGQNETEETSLRDELVQQLVEYKQMKQAANVLRSFWDIRRHMVARERTPAMCSEKFVGNIEAPRLYQAFSLAYQALKKEKKRPIYLQREIYSVEECMQRILYQLDKASQAVALYTIFAECQSKVELIVTFLAVLELLKQGKGKTIACGKDGNSIALRASGR